MRLSSTPILFVLPGRIYVPRRLKETSFYRKSFGSRFPYFCLWAQTGLTSTFSRFLEPPFFIPPVINRASVDVHELVHSRG